MNLGRIPEADRPYSWMFDGSSTTTHEKDVEKFTPRAKLTLTVESATR